MPLPSPLLLAGPTAVGKSEVALLLAEKLGGEIVSVDSMQVYRRLDIGTAKPSEAERERVPHHLIDIVDLTEPFDAAQFLKRARETVTQIQTRNRLPILCGGTGLYFKGFLEGFGDAPPGDPRLRAELERIPLPALLQELAERDRITYEKIDRQNPRRVLRALEVIRLTGKPFSAQRSGWQTPTMTAQASDIRHHGAACFGLIRSAGDLRKRLDRRVEEMFCRGLVAETEALLKRGLADNKTALQALGYRQVAEFLEGKRSLPETIELVKIRTRQFAKRQMTWFRRQLRLNWLHIDEDEPGARVAEQVLMQLKA
jgi:tRNA dimethylallyltransferase